ncbi:hypothetical protein CYMTET_17276 [Cymbomonas tetramitiformis]|uniref:Uncharacterized protein n=1 Tax=Cymbomonas tetramitiformis TaxID=36881 RepID=A0AAE0L744_9CHLO|nr:hypothetical protein CYMTET_17276 [Cymbomonas tetramitiformis]
MRKRNPPPRSGGATSNTAAQLRIWGPVLLLLVAAMPFLFHRAPKVDDRTDGPAVLTKPKVESVIIEPEINTEPHLDPPALPPPPKEDFPEPISEENNSTSEGGSSQEALNRMLEEVVSIPVDTLGSQQVRRGEVLARVSGRFPLLSPLPRVKAATTSFDLSASYDHACTGSHSYALASDSAHEHVSKLRMTAPAITLLAPTLGQALGPGDRGQISWG